MPHLHQACQDMHRTRNVPEVVHLICGIRLGYHFFRVLDHLRCVYTPMYSREWALNHIDVTSLLEANSNIL